MLEPFNRREQKRIDTLKRRISILEERINTDTRDLSYDKAEAKALRWIISLAEGIDLVELRLIDAEKRIQNPPVEPPRERN
jgi:hypothetical protein